LVFDSVIGGPPPDGFSTLTVKPRNIVCLLCQRLQQNAAPYS